MIHTTPPLTQRSCCHTPFVANTFSYLRLAEQVSTVGLAALSAYINFFSFSSFLLLGAGIGIYQRQYEIEGALSNRNGVSCSQGFLEQLTQVKLPPLVSLCINLAITWCHLKHHPKIFVPIIALSIGAQVGQKVSLATDSTCAV